MASNNLNWSLDYYEKHTDECNTFLNSLSDYDQIPLLDPLSVHTLVDGTLVRYSGMIQDMLNPEYYSCSFTVFNVENNETYVKSGKFRDFACCKGNEEIRLEESDFVPKERFVFFCIPTPGTNDWVYDLQKSQISTLQNEKHLLGWKRPVNGDDDDDDDAAMNTDTTELPSPSVSKRKKLFADRADENIKNCTYDCNKYFPINNRNGVPCLIKVYVEEDKSGLLLNDIIEVIGFLSLNPALEASRDDTDIEEKALHPPPSLVPRIHALQIKKLKHWNPLLKQIISYDDIITWAENARNDLHLVLTQLLFEDTLAADYVICNLISRIYFRNENSTIGKFSLNLFNISLPNFAADFYDILKVLVTNSHYVSLSTNLLNETSFVPRKDYESNRLWSGFLQLCSHVHVILDETKMNEGQLNNTGCLNVTALQRLFREQEVEYDFGYYPVKYHTNIPLIVISEGKSMFKADVQLKVKTELCTEMNFNESLEAVRLYLNIDVLNKIRIYLTATRLLDFEFSEEMVGRIGEDYVSMRQQDRQIGSSDLHTLLILSRLLALSHGRKDLKPEDWTQAVFMERERKSRLR